MVITVKQIIKYSIYLIIFASIIYHFFYYWDFKNSCYITIRPSLTEFSNTTIKKGIKYLKANFPKQYKDFCKNVASIDPNISCGGFGGGCFSGFTYNRPAMIDISTPYGEYKQAAKVIIHETCHAMQFKEKRPFSEEECYGKDAVIPWRE